MDPILHEITVDIGGSVKNKLKTLDFKLIKDDTDIYKFRVHIQRNKVAEPLTNVTAATLTFLKEDNNPVVQNMTVSDAENGVIEGILATDVYSYPGYVTFTAELYNGTDKVTSSQSRFMVESDLDDGSSVPAGTEYPVLTQLIADATTAIDNTEAATGAANTAAAAANTAAGSVNTAITNASLATTAANSAASSATSAKEAVEANEATRQTNETTRQANETSRASAESSRNTAEGNRASAESSRVTVESNRVTAESSRVTAETARSNNESARVTAENNRANAESARATAETNRASAESSRVTTENNRGVAETGRANAEITRCNNETTRLNNETTRQTQEAARVTADAARTQKLADIEEEELLTSIDKANYSYAATKDGSDRIIRKLWSQSDSRRIEQRDRSNFDANNNPQTMTRKLFDDNGKGTSYMEHTLTYDDNNKVLSDTAAEKAYEESMLTITRAGKAFNPLKAINPKTGELEVFNNNAFVKSLNTKTVNLANNDTSLDIVGDKVLNTFNTEAQGTIDIDGIPGVFGDTEGVEYNPNQLIEGEAGAVVNIYEAIGGIDVNAAPAPESSPGVVNSAVWRKITEQSRLDKLKSQNEYPVVLSGADGRTITIAGQTLVQQGSIITGQSGYQANWGTIAVAVHDDFLNKEAGKATGFNSDGITPANPNILRTQAGITTLSTPTESPETSNYTGIGSLGGSVRSITATGNGCIPQGILCWNVIADFEAKNGTIPGVTLAEKVAWAKANFSRLDLNAWLFGNCPSGNKAYLNVWNIESNDYSVGYLKNHTYNDAQRLTINISGDIYKYIADDGYVYFNVYTDAASTTSPTFLVLSNHGLRNGSLIFNVTRGNAGRTISTATTNTLFGFTAIDGQQAGDIIDKYNVDATGKNAGVGTNETTIVISNHGLNIGDKIRNATRSGAWASVATIVNADTVTIDTGVIGQTTGDSILLFRYIGQQTAESTVISSTINIDTASIDISLKAPSGYDMYVSPNPRRDAGLGYPVIMGQITRCEQSDAKVTKSGTWTTDNNAIYSGGSEIWSKTVSDYAEFAFWGTGIKLISAKGPNSGIANISIDGGTAVQCDLYNASVLAQQVVYSKTDLPAGNHTIRVTVSGTKNASATDCYVTVDAFEVIASLASEFMTNNSVEIEGITAGKASAALLEFDMTEPCTKLTGGDNAAFKALLKSISADLWALASGSNNGVLTYGFNLQMWYGTAWGVYAGNVLNTIDKVSYTTPTGTGTQNKLNGSNRVYILINPKYPSDGTISSSLSLDSFNVKVDLSRTPDVVALLPVYLPSEWSLVVQGFSPCWATKSSVAYICFLGTDSNNTHIIDLNLNILRYRVYKNDVLQMQNVLPSALTFLKNQVINIGIVRDNLNVTVYYLLNNGTLVSQAVPLSGENINGLNNMSMLKHISNTTGNADAFASRYALIPRALTAEEMEARLRGTQSGFEMPVMTGTVQLFPNNQYHVEGQGDLYVNDYLTRTVTTGDIVTTTYENKIVLTEGSTIQLKM